MNQIIENFNKMYEREDLFIQASQTQIDKLKELFGDKVDKIIDFYTEYQPNNIPMLDSYVNLIGIDNIITENTNGEPGKYLAEYGVYVFAVTVGGNVLCIDTNDVKDGDASVLIAENNFCSYNRYHKCIEIGVIPKEEEFDINEFLYLNYANIKRCIKKIEDSFFEFMIKLSNNEYEDMEEYLN